MAELGISTRNYLTQARGEKPGTDFPVPCSSNNYTVVPQLALCSPIASRCFGQKFS